MLGCFLYLIVVFKGWSMFSERRSELSNFRILRLITVSEKKLVSPIATSSSFVIRVSSFSASFILSEDCNLFDKKGLRILTSKKHRQIKPQCIQKLQIWAFGSLVHQVDSLTEKNWEKIFRKTILFFSYWQNSFLCDRSNLYSPLCLSQHWLLVCNSKIRLLACNST